MRFVGSQIVSAAVSATSVETGHMASKPAREKWLGYAVFHVLSMPVNRPDVLDKLGVTGSSPVPPTQESPAQRGFRFLRRQRLGGRARNMLAADQSSTGSTIQIPVNPALVVLLEPFDVELVVDAEDAEPSAA